ncbi:hypothetical protein GCM10017771_73640 [Streptomyces capitiformicae]|uniref:Uncharacterized protein n=1 Tax=Streptomyces capitiformicae TaxID=2014920 RepID=A0A918ZG24_9ACTN|nr:hypothetical protein GCM10017771_73640 [Streptomyces capitiformicae]
MFVPFSRVLKGTLQIVAGAGGRMTAGPDNIRHFAGDDIDAQRDGRVPRARDARPGSRTPQPGHRHHGVPGRPGQNLNH